MVADLDVAGGEAVAGQVGGRFCRTDVADEAAVAASVACALDTFGRLDIMVNNAGVVGPIGSLLETSVRDWSRAMAILLDSVFYGIKHAAIAMRGQGGVILSTASVAGMRGGLGPHAYTAAKHGVVGLTLSAAAELASQRIRVNAVAPGKTDTAMPHQLRAALDPTVASPPAEIAPEEIAGAFAYLASDLAVNVTGQVLAVDRGVVGFGGQAPALLQGGGRFVTGRTLTTGADA